MHSNKQSILFTPQKFGKNDRRWAKWHRPSRPLFGFWQSAIKKQLKSAVSGETKVYKLKLGYTQNFLLALMSIQRKTLS